MVPATPKASAAAGGSWSCSIYGAGNTRVQLARRVLTGGWGWNTTHFDATNGSADALLRTDGVMDQYKVRWGVSYYDGLGTRLVVDPTANNLAAGVSTNHADWGPVAGSTTTNQVTIPLDTSKITEFYRLAYPYP